MEDIILDTSKMLKQFMDDLREKLLVVHWNVLNLELKPILGSLDLLFPELCQLVQAPVGAPILHREDIC